MAEAAIDVSDVWDDDGVRLRFDESLAVDDVEGEDECEKYCCLGE